MKLHSYIIATTALVGLAACGGGNSTSATNGEGLYNAISSGSVARALDDGKSIAAKHTASIQIDWDAGETEVGNDEISVRKTDEGHLAFTVNGTEHVMTAADIDDEYGYRIQDGDNSYWVSFSSYDGELVEDLDPADGGYVQVYFFYTDVDGNGIAQRGNTVIGTETDVAQLDLLTTATYEGWMNLDFAPDSGYTGGNSQVRVRGDMEMIADFTDSTISGNSVLGELRLRDGDADEVFMEDGVVTYDAAIFNGTSFAGSISVDADFLDNTGVGVVDANYEGSFYGPFADETAGIISGTSEGGFNVLGQFNADRRD